MIFGPEGSSSAVRLIEELAAQWMRAFPDYPILAQPLSFRGGPAAEPPGECQACRLPTFMDGWGADYPDPHDFLSLLWTTGSEVTISHASVPQVDALLAQADRMSDRATRMLLYQQAEQLLINQGVSIPLLQNVTWYTVRSRVVGWQVAPMGVTPLSVWQRSYITR